ncbi:tyrosine-type recombinase/integrase [Nocardia tengchongensis]|uniref:tyrosine-type recombinase/integrase n=1 Tax=Nocardia tengchongensis TaxID=2055889 RepID=UPI0033E48D90
MARRRRRVGHRSLNRPQASQARREGHPALTDGQIKGLLKAYRGKGFRDRRDEAIVRLMLETAMRAGECADIALADTDVRRGLVTVQRGKGSKGRIVPFGLQTGRSLDRYLHARRTHRLADSPKL